MREKFAEGFNFYKVFWIFVLGGILGCLVETVWCYFAFGELSSRTSNLFLPFSTVWGLGCALFSILLHGNGDKRTGMLFIKGYVLGGVFEFFCGWICQQALGVTFWDYSGLPLSLGNYVNLVFLCFLGYCGDCVDKEGIPISVSSDRTRACKRGTIATWCMVGFMILSISVSALALMRMSARHENKPATNRIESHLDKYYTDQLLEQFFPKMKYIS